MDRFEPHGFNSPGFAGLALEASQAVNKHLDGSPMVGYAGGGTRLFRAPRLPGDDQRFGSTDAVDLSARQHLFVPSLNQLVLQRSGTEIWNQNLQSDPPQ